MKKTAALLLILILVLLTAASLAETKQFIIANAADTEGNELDISGLPSVALQLDDRAMICWFGVGGSRENGALTITDRDDGFIGLHAVMEDGAEYDMTYVTEDGTVYVVDTGNGIVYSLISAVLY